MTTEQLVKALGREYEAQVDLLTTGRLFGEWVNVARHCLVQALAIRELAQLLGLHERDVRVMTEVAACHDWDKHWEKYPADFTKDDQGRMERGVQAALFTPLHRELLAATKGEFLLTVERGDALFLQFIQYLMDDMTMEDKIVSVDTRLDEVAERDPNPFPEVTAQLGGRLYWDVERAVAHDVEQMVFAALRMRRVSITSADQLAALLNLRIETKYGGKLTD